MSAEPATTIPPRVLIACVGNIFLGDDGFGVEVARRLTGRRFPPGVEMVDFGIRGVELAYTLLDGCDTLVLVDAVPRGSPPGTLYLIEPRLPAPAGDAREAASSAGISLQGHSMDPARVLAFAQELGARPGRVLLVGCQPETPSGGEDDPDGGMRMGLSAPVRAAVDEAVKMIESLIEDLCAIAPAVALDA